MKPRNQPEDELPAMRLNGCLVRKLFDESAKIQSTIVGVVRIGQKIYFESEDTGVGNSADVQTLVRTAHDRVIATTSTGGVYEIEIPWELLLYEQISNNRFSRSPRSGVKKLLDVLL
jgi:hypothetical protein